MGKNSTVIYHSYRKRFEDFSKAQFGELILAALLYDETGEISYIEDQRVKDALQFIKYDIDTNRESYKETSVKNKAAADKRWGNANECERIQPHANAQKHADTESDTDTDIEDMNTTTSIIEAYSKRFGEPNATETEKLVELSNTYDYSKMMCGIMIASQRTPKPDHPASYIASVLLGIADKEIVVGSG